MRLSGRRGDGWRGLVALRSRMRQSSTRLTPARRIAAGVW